MIIGSKRDVRSRLNKKAVEELYPIIKKYYKDGRTFSDQIVSKDLKALSTKYGFDLNFKKELIENFNNTKSIFTGYYDRDGEDLFKIREVEAIKRSILQANQNEWTETRMIQSIKKDVNITTQRARVIARTETTRLDAAAVDIYYQKSSKIRKSYDKKWVNSVAYPDHKPYDGQIADKDGMFTMLDGSKVAGPPPTNRPWNCRCKVTLIKKKPEGS